MKLTITDLKGAEYNPRSIKKEAICALKTSLFEFGDISGIVWNAKTRNLVCGHQRLRALKEEHPDLKVEDNVVVAGDRRFPIRVVDWDLATEKAANIAANSPLLSGQFTENLQGLLDELQADLPTLFGELRLDELSLQGIKLKDGLTDPDDVPEPPEEPVTRVGDLWLLGQHRLLCGDATKAEDVEQLMAGVKAHMVFTDPPYNVDYGANKRHPSWKVRKIQNDKQSPEEWETFCKAVFANIKAFCKGDVYVWGASGPDGMRMRLWLHEMGCHWSATIIWRKQQLVLSPAKYQRIYEPCFYGWFDKSSYAADRKQVEVWEFDRPLNSKLHPTMKPVRLCAQGIVNSSRTGNVVLDLFGGSGSTLIACEQANRKCRMMEIDAKYCDVIVRRWEEFTGNKAKQEVT